MALLEERGLTPRVVEYLNNPLTASELKDLLGKLDLPASALVRTGEAIYKELDLSGASESDLLAAIAEHPKLMQRPIVVNGDRAAIGRPPEGVLAIL